MKRIEEYVEKVYKNFDQKDEETKILKEETKAHLLEEVEELKKEGLSQEESVEKAISNFGSEKAVINEMNSILKRQNIFSVVLKRVALAFFLVACVCFAIKLVDETIHLNDPNPFTADTNSTAYVFDIIENKIIDKYSLDTELKNEITQLLDEFNMKSNNGIYYVKILRADGSKEEYEYKKDGMEYSNFGQIGLTSEGKRTWDIHHKLTNEQHYYDMLVQRDTMYRMINRVPYRLGQIANYLFVISGVLLCVYLLTKRYLKGYITSKAY